MVEFARPPHRGQGHRRRLAARARRRSSPSSVYPALDRQIAADGAAEADHAGRATARGACRNGDAIYAEALRAGDDDQLHARRSPPDRPRPGRRDQRASSTRSSRARATPQGSVGERLAALNTTPRAALSRTPTPGRAELLAEPQRRREGHVRAPAAGLRDPAQRSRSRSAACRRRSRTARRTAITTAPRSMARGRRSTSST